LAVSFMLSLYLRAQELGGALEVADELPATDRPRRRSVCRGGVFPTLQQAPIVAIAERRPEALHGTTRRRDAMARGGSVCPRRARKAVDGFVGEPRRPG
jgi:hypothetical protein